MVCFHPLIAYKLTDKTGSVKVKIVGKCRSEDDYVSDLGVTPQYERLIRPRFGSVEMLKLPCGQCIGCRLERSREWAVRCVHEASLWPKNAFLTLTYDDVHLPSDLSLHKEHLQDFWKRLRKSLDGVKIRYFAAGEYGSLLSRPHYHACVFNYWPYDAKLWRIRHGTRLYVSPSLAKIWPFGYHVVGEVTFESAAYVARYCLKKITGDQAEEHYHGLEPEFVVMSRRPGIAKEWIEKYRGDVYPNDFVVIRDNIKCRPPRYYDKIYDDIDGNLDYVKNKRMDRRFLRFWDELQRIEKVNLVKSKKKEGIFNRSIEK